MENYLHSLHHHRCAGQSPDWLFDSTYAEVWTWQTSACHGTWPWTAHPDVSWYHLGPWDLETWYNSNVSSHCKVDAGTWTGMQFFRSFHRWTWICCWHDGNAHYNALSHEHSTITAFMDNNKVRNELKAQWRKPTCDLQLIPAHQNTYEYYWFSVNGANLHPSRGFLAAMVNLPHHLVYNSWHDHLAARKLSPMLFNEYGQDNLKSKMQNTSILGIRAPLSMVMYLGRHSAA